MKLFLTIASVAAVGAVAALAGMSGFSGETASAGAPPAGFPQTYEGSYSGYSHYNWTDPPGKTLGWDVELADLVFEFAEATGGEATYRLVSGRAHYVRHDYSPESCAFDGETGFDLSPGTLEVVVSGASYDLNAIPAAGPPHNVLLIGAVVKPGTICNNVLMSVNYVWGNCEHTDFPVSDVQQLTLDYEVTGPYLDEPATATCVQNLSLTGDVASILVNSTGDAPDDGVEAEECDTGSDILVDGLQVPECTLRAALTTTSELTTPSTIRFDMPGGNVIFPMSDLPPLIGGVRIDGGSQPDSAVVVLNGRGGPTTPEVGLGLQGTGNRVEGMQIEGFLSAGILVTGEGPNTIAGNYIGTDVSGAETLGNGVGIRIENGSLTQIGGANESDGNVIGNNVNGGVWILGVASEENTLAGNYIGVTETGVHVPNGVGVNIEGGHDNHIGTADTGNVIAANVGDGVALTGSRDNTISSNYIGITREGAVAGNGGDGVYLQDSKENSIGTLDFTTAHGNFIGGNALSGIQILGASAIDNQVVGNRIGMSAQGTLAANAKDGIVINGAPGNKIGPALTDLEFAANYIGGNTRYGLLLASANTHDTKVLGNYFGLTPQMQIAANGDDNILIEDSWSNTIGQPQSGNIIVGSQVDGIEIRGAGAHSNVVSGNFVGNDGDATAIPNGGNGVYVVDAPNNWIGKDEPSAGNVFSGNELYGVAIQGAAAAGNQVAGNAIGVIDAGNGLIALPNGNGIALIGARNTAVAGNVISGNNGNGVDIIGHSTGPATRNAVYGNAIGTENNGEIAIPNGSNGVRLLEGAESNVIGPEFNNARICDYGCNVISGNGGNGIEVQAGALNNLVMGNLIGLANKPDCLDMTQPLSAFVGCDLGNGGAGVLVTGTDNSIGGLSRNGECSGDCNLIAFNNTGVAVTGSGTENFIAANSIFLNGGLNIDLGADGLTPNDGDDQAEIWDTDSGPNGLLNKPEPTAAYDRGDKVYVVFDMFTNPNTEILVDVFVNNLCSNAKPGVQVYVGSVEFTTQAPGWSQIGRQLPLPAGDWGFATAVATDGEGNSSEVSACQPITVAATSLSSGAASGQSQISVQDTDIALPGDNLQIGTGANQETVTLSPGSTLAPAAAGTLTLASPLQKNHSSGEAVVVIGSVLGTLVTWADFDCDGHWDTADALALLRTRSGITDANGSCPSIDTVVSEGGQALLWGDTDGNGIVDAADVITVLRTAARLRDEAPRWMPRQGEQVQLIWSN